MGISRVHLAISSSLTLTSSLSPHARERKAGQGRANQRHLMAATYAETAAPMMAPGGLHIDARWSHTERPRPRVAPTHTEGRPPSTLLVEATHEEGAAPTAAPIRTPGGSHRTEVASATNPGGEVGLLAMLDDDRHDGSEGSTGHPTRALPPAEIDLPGGARSGSSGG